jgi:hypothetical protein
MNENPNKQTEPPLRTDFSYSDVPKMIMKAILATARDPRYDPLTTILIFAGSPIFCIIGWLLILKRPNK